MSERLAMLQRRVAAKDADARQVRPRTADDGAVVELGAASEPATTESSAHAEAGHEATHRRLSDGDGGSDPPPLESSVGQRVDVILPGGHVASAPFPPTSAHAGSTLFQADIGPTLYCLPVEAGDSSHYARAGVPAEDDMPISEVIWWGETMKDPAGFRLYQDGARGTPPPYSGHATRPPAISLSSCRPVLTTSESMAGTTFSLSRSGGARALRSRRTSGQRR